MSSVLGFTFGVMDAQIGASTLYVKRRPPPLSQRYQQASPLSRSFRLWSGFRSLDRSLCFQFAAMWPAPARSARHRVERR
jgi:hypothetical protein